MHSDLSIEEASNHNKQMSGFTGFTGVKLSKGSELHGNLAREKSNPCGLENKATQGRSIPIICSIFEVFQRSLRGCNERWQMFQKTPGLASGTATSLS